MVEEQWIYVLTLWQLRVLFSKSWRETREDPELN